jgi:hypothetical protein
MRTPVPIVIVVLALIAGGSVHAITPLEGMKQIAQRYSRGVKEQPSRDIARKPERWPETVEKLVRIRFDDIPILSRPTLLSKKLEIIALAREGEIAKHIEDKTIALLHNPLSRAPSDNGIWYLVELLDERQGWILGQPSGEEVIAEAFKNPLHDPEKILKKKIENFKANLKPVVIGKKTFMRLRRPLIIDSVEYESGTYFDVTDNHPAVTALVTADGSVARIRPLREHEVEYIDLNWDVANNLATGEFRPSQIIKRYFYWVSSIAGSVFMEQRTTLHSFLLFGSIAYFAFIYWVKNNFVVSIGKFLLIMVAFSVPFAFVLAIFLDLSRGHTESYLRYLHAVDVRNLELDSMKTEEGLLFPLSKLPYVERSGWDTFRNIFYVPLFIVFHVGYLATIPYLVKGLHYLVVPHPAEEYIDEAVRPGRHKKIDVRGLAQAIHARIPTRLPPVFVSKNYSVKARALRARVDADRRLMESVIDRERTRGKFEDKE